MATSSSIKLVTGDSSTTISAVNGTGTVEYTSADNALSGGVTVKYTANSDSSVTFRVSYIIIQTHDNANRWIKIQNSNGNTTGAYRISTAGSYIWAQTFSWDTTVSKTHSAATTDKPLYIYFYTDSACTTLERTWAFHIQVTAGAKTSYTVSYAANGGSSTPTKQTKWYGETLALRGSISRASSSPGNYTVTLNGNGASNPSALTSKRTTSYAFKNWKATNGTAYAASANYTSNAATTMTAQWTSSESRAAVTLPSITRSGYSWVRWNTKSDNSGTGYANGASYTPSGNITLYAIWNRTVTYNANGGSGAPSAQTNLATSALALSTTKPTLSGYSFNRWNTKANNTGTGYASGGTYAAQQPSITLYAIWNRTLSYDANGGSGAPSAQTSVKSSAITISSTKPTRTGYVFKGWSTSSSGAVAYQPGGTYAADNPTRTLHAVWAPAASISGVTRTDDQGNTDILGGYVKVDFTVSNQTSCTVSIAATGQTFSATPSQSGSVILGDGSLLKINPEKAYTITITAVGGTYSSGSNTVSYTLAKSVYTRPLISSILTERVSWDGTLGDFVSDEEGSSLKLTLGWSVYSAQTSSQTVDISVSASDDGGQAVDLSQSQPTVPAGTFSDDQSIFYFPAVGSSSGPFTTEKNYLITVTVDDTFTTVASDISVSRSDKLSASFYAMDVLGDAYYYQLTADTVVDSSKTYYTKSGSGSPVDPFVYVPVASPSAEDLATYYEKSGPRPGHGISFGGPARTEGMHVHSDSSDLGNSTGFDGDGEGAINVHSKLVNVGTPSNPVTPLSDVYHRILTVKDAGERVIGCVTAVQFATGGQGLMLESHANDANGDSVYNHVLLESRNDGSVNIHVTHPAKWREAIDALALSGGTVTGDVVHEAANIYVDNSVIDRDGSTPSSEQIGQQIIFRDKDNERIGFVRVDRETDGMKLKLYAFSEKADGTEVYNGLKIGIDQGANRMVTVTESAPWRTALGFTVVETTTVSDIATAASGFTINSATFTTYGKVAMLTMSIKTTNAISSGNITNVAMVTLKSGKWPKNPTPISALGTGPVISGYVQSTNGNVVLAATAGSIAANSSFDFGATYILA